jgi:hypothetical protein
VIDLRTSLDGAPLTPEQWEDVGEAQDELDDLRSHVGRVANLTQELVGLQEREVGELRRVVGDAAHRCRAIRRGVGETSFNGMALLRIAEQLEAVAFEKPRLAKQENR